MKIIDVSRPPKELWLGRDGENNWRPIAFECASWLGKRPDGIITVWMEANGSKFPLSSNMDGTKAVWYPQQEELFIGGSRIEVSIQSGDDVGISAIIECHVDESLIGNGEHPAQTAPPWTVKVVADVTEQADRAKEASEHYPKIISGVWYVWSVSDEDFVSTGISAQGEDGFSPTVTVTAIEGGHRVTITDASGDHTFDVMDGEGGTSADAVLYTEQTLNDSQKAQARENIGAKPPIYLKWDDTVDPGICEKSATEIALLFADGYDVHLPMQAFRGYDLRLRSAFVVDNALVVEFGDVFVKEGGGLENITATVDEQKHIDVGRTHISSAELEISKEIDDWADGKALDAGTAKEVLNQILDEVGDELNSKPNASDIPTKTSDLTNNSGFVTAQQAAASAPVQSVNGETGAVVLDAADVHALPDSTVIPPAVTEQTVAGWGFTKNTGTYSKPSGGIPASDLAAGVIPDISGKANAADVYTKTEVDQKLVGAMDYKGTKATVSALPTSGNKTGDVWHITADGSEWAWNGSAWEELGTAVDLSGYATESWVQNQGYLTQHQSLAAYRTASAQDAIDAAQDSAIAAKYTKPSGGIPDSDIASAAVWNTKGTYSKPSGGIPKTDLASDVAASLGKADTALQEHQSLTAYRTSADQDTIDEAQNTEIAAKYTKPSGGIPASDLASGVIPAVPIASAAAPLMDGISAAGSSTSYARADHVHPSDTTRLSTTGNAYRSASIPMGHLDATSTATVMTATVEGITELRDGVCMWLQNGVVTSASGFTLNVNGLGAKPCYSSLAATSRSTTIFNANYALLFVYNSTRVEGGCWDIVYGVDTNTTYTTPKLGFGYGTCTTAAATAAKTASISSYALTAGGIVSIKFENDVPAGATLNITSKGAKAIYHRGAAITAGVIKAGDTATFVYSTYYHLISIDRDEAGDTLPAVTASDNGKFLRVVSGAWAAATIPAAESNSFGGGS